MFAKIIFFCALAIASICAKPQLPLAYSSPLLANPAVAVASPYAAYTSPVAAAYTAASAPLTAAYPSPYAAYPYAAYNSVFL